ncbi:MAG TPA: DNA-3-methyladenine glycosylase 2 family protein [Acidimicrobiia bacterium]|nr:DNA-3-methyladenine glycosylase 2 family protein [Acidimicrobiia bacterium]
MSPSTLPAADAALIKVEPRFAPLVHAFGPCTIGGRSPRPHFEALARSIAYQQLAGRAASTIWGRVRALVPGRFVPEAVLALKEEQLRGAGLSGAKTASIRDLALKVSAGEVPLARIGRLDDEQIIERLVVVRGIGRWTAEMFLMFQLGRLDVWPAGDYGVRKGFSVVSGIDPIPTEREMAAHGERFAPYRSVAAWYCWRVLDGEAAAAAE